MTEVKKQKGSSLQGMLIQEEEQDDRVTEWEEGLPSLADLISLSQCLISPQLASAFSITPPSPSPACSPADVALASHSTFSALRSSALTLAAPFGGSDAQEGNPPFQSYAGGYGGENSQLNAGGGTCHGADASPVSPGSPGNHSLHAGHASAMIHKRHLHSDERSTLFDAQARSYGGGVAVREWNGSSQPSVLAKNLESYVGDTSVRKEGSSAPSEGYKEVILIPSEGDEDGAGEGDGHVHANAALCISDSSDAAAQADDGEAEEAESAPSPSENPNEETTARTLKRPRLVWTPELHKRFVDAVSHLGVKIAVPKTIMQLMNVEGLTRENVASHLQKYRLYLKRMQGLSNEGPTSSDHLFASTPVPANLAAGWRFNAGMPAHLQDISQVPFAPAHNPVSMGRGHLTGIISSSLPPMDPYSFNVFARPPSHRLVQGDLQDMPVFRQHHSSSLLQHIPKK